MKTLLLNVGHAWHPESYDAFFKLIGHNKDVDEFHEYRKIINIDFDKDDLRSVVDAAIKPVKQYADGGYGIYLVPHGTSIVTAHSVSYLYGLIGMFPKIVIMRPDPDRSLYFPVAIQDLGKTRSLARGRR